MAISDFYSRAVFFDKDGTLVNNIPYNIDPQKISFTEGAEDILNCLRDLFQFHVITNQPGIAMGMFEEEALDPVRKRLCEMFSKAGALLKDFHYCPHHPEGVIESYRLKCACRKPGPQMLLRASEYHRINLHDSWMIGDILDDIEAGKSAGCRTILLDVGNETEWVLSEQRTPDYVVKNLSQAGEVILSNRSALYGQME